MSANTFDNLETRYPRIIDMMPNEFDSHEFILKLAHEHQRLYVQALIDYADNEQPFKIVHGIIAKRLHNFPELVTKIGEGSSEDIFRQVKSAAVWQKIL